MSDTSKDRDDQQGDDSAAEEAREEWEEAVDREGGDETAPPG